MRFDVRSQLGFTGAVPETLREFETLDPASAVRTRQFLLRKGSEPCAGQRWVIKSRNEQGVDVGELWDDVTEFPQLGTTEIWEFANPTVVPHPMHMHLVMFQILDRQDFEFVEDQIVPTGSPVPPAPEEAGWKDTARAEPGQILRVIARFEDYEGEFPYHCHILEHEDHEMMRQFRTIEGVHLEVGPAAVEWGSVPGTTGYEMVRGDLSALRATRGDYSSCTLGCVVDGQSVNAYEHSGELPPQAGEGYWYLSRTRDVVGRGTYDSGHRTQVGWRDAPIEASGQGCTP